MENEFEKFTIEVDGKTYQITEEMVNSNSRFHVVVGDRTITFDADNEFAELRAVGHEYEKNEAADDLIYKIAYAIESYLA